MAAMPAMNLDPAATPWGRAMQKELADIRATVDRSVQVELNANKMQNSSINALTRQVVDLTAVTVELEATNAELVAQQAELEATVAAQVYPKAGTGSGSGFTVDSTSSTTTSFVLTTPVGYTKAVVMASGTIAVANESATADYLYVRVVIAGNAGPEATVAVGSTASGTFWGSLSAAHALTFGGLTDGQTVTVTVSARTGGINFGNSAYNKAQIAGQAVFYR